MHDFFQIYNTLLQDIPREAAVTSALSGTYWTAVESGCAMGLAMTVPENTAPRMLSGSPEGTSLRTLAEASKSWNLAEAGFGVAAINAYYNTPEHLEELKVQEPFDNFCTRGLDLSGKQLGLVGHLTMPESVLRQAAGVRILERVPQPGDYPDSACDWLLPQCDVVIITASTLVNKTLPHLLELCRDAYTILVGPSCPMCPALLEMGIQRLSGLVITRREAMISRIREDLAVSPYPLGIPFLLTEECL